MDEDDQRPVGWAGGLCVRELATGTPTMTSYKKRTWARERKTVRQARALDGDMLHKERAILGSRGAYPVEGLLVSAVREGVFSECLYRHGEKV